MKIAYPRVSLGELLRLERRPIDVLADKQYQEIGIYCFGKGIFHKVPRTGLEVGDKDLYLLKEGDFILQVTFSWEGAIAIVSASEDGMYGSTRYPTFRVDEERCVPRFLLRYFETHEGLQQLVKICPGSAGRNRVLSIKRIPEVFVPLPSPLEQRRILTRIDGLDAKIGQARSLRLQTDEEIVGLFDSALNDKWSTQSNWQRKQLGQLAQTVSGQVDPRVEPYANLPHINGEVIEAGTCRLLQNYRLAKEDGVTSGKYHFPPNSVLYSKIRPYLRKAAQIPFEGICSADVYAFDRFDADIDPRFFMYSLVAPPFTKYANALSGRTRMPKVNQDQMFRFELAYPSLPEQRRIVTFLDRLLEKVVLVRKSQADTSAELSALMPSILDKAFAGEL
jgi:type I restriction enzyme S subunit